MASQVKPLPRSVTLTRPAANRVNKYDYPDRNKPIRRPSILVTHSLGDIDLRYGGPRGRGMRENACNLLKVVRRYRVLIWLLVVLVVLDRAVASQARRWDAYVPPVPRTVGPLP